MKKGTRSFFFFVLPFIFCFGCVTVTIQDPNVKKTTPLKPTVVALQPSATVILPPNEIAINMLQRIPEVKQIMQVVERAGRKAFFTDEEIVGEIVTLSLRESFPEDEHTSRIDTFVVNTKTGRITIWDVITDEQVNIENWKEKVSERFPLQ